ncbi:DNA/RNA non-specific endonuclease [Roseibium sp.]|uniref:DNA/RNA non-specific endonuclease n=1 Tax=Roseibium sp. TaxID=1936156 RepID=UPI003BA8E1A6
MHSIGDIEKNLLSGENEPVLRAYLGDELFNELKPLADELNRISQDESASFLASERARKHVYVLPGIMGSRLSARRFLLDDLIWLDPKEIPLGGLKKLKLSDNSREIYASGVIQPPYLKLKFSLRLAGYRVTEMPYDWRLTVAELGRRAHARIQADGVSNAILVCHSMGGLVARAVADLDQNKSLVEQVVTIGTPNYGSYSPVEVFALTSKMLRAIGKIDQIHTPQQLAKDIIRHFPGLVEMMPSPDRRPSEPFFTPAGWPSGGAAPTAVTLQNADQNRASLAAPDTRFYQIIGINQSTVQSAQLSESGFTFFSSFDGDGTVPRDLAEMGDVPRYYVEGEHGWLANQGDVIDAVKDLIAEKKTDVLPTRPPASLTSLASEGATATGVASAELRTQIDNQMPSAGEMTENDILGQFVGGGHQSMMSTDIEGAAVKKSQSSDSANIPGPQSAIFSERYTQTATDAGATSFIDKIAGYPIGALENAVDVWEINEERRIASEKHASVGASLKAEPKERQQLYTKRLADEVKRIIEEDPTLQVPTAIAETLSTMESGLDGINNERIVGDFEEFVSVKYLKRAPIVLRSVGRITYKHAPQSGFGTGFLVAPGILITNHHVLPTMEEARRSMVQMDYELRFSEGTLPSHEFHLLPDQFFVTNAELDFSVVAVAPNSLTNNASLSTYGYIPVMDVLGKARAEGPVNIIQHPQGRLKEVVFRESKMLPLPETTPANTTATGHLRDNVLQYTGDTLQGSSGSPVFSDRWEVIGLHHSGVPQRNEAGDYLMDDMVTYRSVADLKANPHMQKNIYWRANQGIRISKIIRHLEAAQNASQSPKEIEYLERILKIGRNAGRNGAFAHMRPRVPDPYINSDESDKTRHPEPMPASGNDASSANEYSSGNMQTRAESGEQRFQISVPLEVTVRLGGHGPEAVSTVVTPPREPFSIASERRYRPEELADRLGFDRSFLCERVEMPKLLNTSPYNLVQRLDGNGSELTYDHYSVLMCKERRLAFVSAGNFDASARKRATRDKEPWSLDPRIGSEHQANNDFYKSNDLDRGHLFRRADGAWGKTRDAAIRADHDTYFWTNIAPQHKVYNRSSLEQEWLLWGQLENHVAAQARDGRVSIFNGPVFSTDDPSHRGLQIPQAFWKIVLSCDNGRLRAHAFRIGQESLLNDLPAERFSAGAFGVYQVKIRNLERDLHLDFGRLTGRDAMEDLSLAESLRGTSGIRVLRSVDDIVL